MKLMTSSKVVNVSINPLHPPENIRKPEVCDQRFYDVFMGYRKRLVA